MSRKAPWTTMPNAVVTRKREPKRIAKVSLRRQEENEIYLKRKFPFLRAGGRRYYWKCHKIRGRWTRGPGTDLRLKTHACKF